MQAQERKDCRNERDAKGRSLGLENAVDVTMIGRERVFSDQGAVGSVSVSHEWRGFGIDEGVESSKFKYCVL